MITGLNVYDSNGIKFQIPIIIDDALYPGVSQVEPIIRDVANTIADITEGFKSWVEQAANGLGVTNLPDLIHTVILPTTYTSNNISTLCANVLTASQAAGIAPQIGTALLDNDGYNELHFADGSPAGYFRKYDLVHAGENEGIIWTSTKSSTGNNRIGTWYWPTNSAGDDNPRYAISMNIPVFPSRCLVGNKFVAQNITEGTESAYVRTLNIWCYYRYISIRNRYIFGHASVLHSQSDSISTADFINLFPAAVELEVDPAYTDPYTGAGYTPSAAEDGLSEGTFDFTDNGLTDVNTPGIDLLGSGFLTAWNVNKAQLNALANWLWVTTPSQIFQQIYGNPINAVIGLNVVPVAPSIDGGANTIKFGPEDSGVAAPKITSQYVSVDCGTLTIAPVYGSYMDYGPYSSAELFLPYCGGVPLDINDVVGKTISVKYQVDILSGACVAYIFIDGHLHYQKSGCCAGTAPVTGSQMPNVISGVLSIVGSVAGAVASLGASGASTAAKVASGIATGTNVADAATNALKRSISYSGTVSGWAGLLGAQKPYLILTLPNAAIPAGQQQLSGYPAWVGGQISSFSGHTECANVHLNGLRATDEEMQEIRTLLESGVIL